MVDKAENMSNLALASQLLEQAAKEVGGHYTNKREFSGPNGGPIQTYDLSKADDDDLKKLEALLAKVAPE